MLQWSNIKDGASVSLRKSLERRVPIEKNGCGSGLDLSRRDSMTQPRVSTLGRSTRIPTALKGRQIRIGRTRTKTVSELLLQVLPGTVECVRAEKLNIG